MHRFLLPLTLLLCSGLASAQTKRPLQLEDYYRMKSVGSPSISPDGAWVTYTVSQPVEENNGTLGESWIVRADGAGQPARVQRNGENVSNPGWTADGRLRFTHANATWTIDPARPTGPATQLTETQTPGAVSPDGRWRARTRQLSAPPRPASSVTPFEQRHEERFKGDAFDWYPFRQDGQRFPLPDRRQIPPPRSSWNRRAEAARHAS
jgi:dipeptidyl aminopeptidase/acylaminoacyl peptidase